MGLTRKLNFLIWFNMTLDEIASGKIKIETILYKPCVELNVGKIVVWHEGDHLIVKKLINEYEGRELIYNNDLVLVRDEKIESSRRWLDGVLSNADINLKKNQVFNINQIINRELHLFEIIVTNKILFKDLI